MYVVGTQGEWRDGAPSETVSQGALRNSLPSPQNVMLMQHYRQPLRENTLQGIKKKKVRERDINGPSQTTKNTQNGQFLLEFFFFSSPSLHPKECATQIKIIFLQPAR